MLSLPLFVRPHAIVCVFLFFFNDTATTEICTLSLHDALPISQGDRGINARGTPLAFMPRKPLERSEEHTSELQSHEHLVCRLLLEKKKMRLSAEANKYLRVCACGLLRRTVRS